MRTRAHLGVLLIVPFALGCSMGREGSGRASVADAGGWIDLFPGKDLAGWRRVPIDPLAAKPVWSISADGKTLLIDGVEAKEMLLHEKERGDGVFQVEWRFRKLPGEKPVYNGGVYVRSSLDGQVWVQAQVAHADKPPVVGDLFGMTPVAGTLARTEVFQRGPDRSRPPGDWNTYRITCRGKRVSLEVNGAVTATWEDCGVARGHLGLQAEFSPIEVRSLKFKPLES